MVPGKFAPAGIIWVSSIPDLIQVTIQKRLQEMRKLTTLFEKNMMYGMRQILREHADYIVSLALGMTGNFRRAISSDTPQSFLVSVSPKHVSIVLYRFDGACALAD
jgi:hypothetical protein